MEITPQTFWNNFMNDKTYKTFKNWVGKSDADSKLYFYKYNYYLTFIDYPSPPPPPSSLFSSSSVFFISLRAIHLEPPAGICFDLVVSKEGINFKFVNSFFFVLFA